MGALDPLHVPAAEVPGYWRHRIRWNVLLSGDATAGQLTMLEQLMPRDAGPVPHLHERYDEGFHLLDGEIDFVVGEGEARRRFTAAAGDAVWIPRRTVHSFVVVSESSRALNFYTPGGWDDHLAFLALPAPEGRGMPDRVLPEPSAEEQAAFARRAQELNTQRRV